LVSFCRELTRLSNGRISEWEQAVGVVEGDPRDAVRLEKMGVWVK
jgi:hypothetical protein